MSSSNDIEVMIHYFCTMSPHPRLDAPVVADAVRRLVAAGLLEEDTGSYQPTEGGHMYMDALRAVPWPVRGWVVPKVDSN